MTDLGYITQLVAERLRGSNLVVIESNHDPDMFKGWSYPWSLSRGLRATSVIFQR